MIMVILTLYCLLMYVVAWVDAIAIKQTMTWKDWLFFVGAPVTIPVKMVVILWVLIRPPFW